MSSQPKEQWELELDAEIKAVKASPFCICGAKKRKGAMLCPSCDNEATYLLAEFIKYELDPTLATFSPINLNAPTGKSDAPIKTIKTDSPIKPLQSSNPDAARAIEQAMNNVLGCVESLGSVNLRIMDAFDELQTLLDEQRGIVIDLNHANNALSFTIRDHDHELTDADQTIARDALGVTASLARRFRDGDTKLRDWMIQYRDTLYSKGAATTPREASAPR